MGVIEERNELPHSTMHIHKQLMESIWKLSQGCDESNMDEGLESGYWSLVKDGAWRMQIEYTEKRRNIDYMLK